MCNNTLQALIHWLTLLDCVVNYLARSVAPLNSCCSPFFFSSLFQLNDVRLVLPFLPVVGNDDLETIFAFYYRISTCCMSLSSMLSSSSDLSTRNASPTKSAQNRCWTSSNFCLWTSWLLGSNFWKSVNMEGCPIKLEPYNQQSSQNSHQLRHKPNQTFCDIAVWFQLQHWRSSSKEQCSTRCTVRPNTECGQKSH